MITIRTPLDSHPGTLLVFINEWTDLVRDEAYDRAAMIAIGHGEPLTALAIRELKSKQETNK